jgi:hypothetical protein
MADIFWRRVAAGLRRCAAVVVDCVDFDFEAIWQSYVG